MSKKNSNVTRAIIVALLSSIVTKQSCNYINNNAQLMVSVTLRDRSLVEKTKLRENFLSSFSIFTIASHSRDIE